MQHMGYCRFINTLENLRDCHEHMDDGDLSVMEDKARKHLIRLCQQIGEKYADPWEENDDDA